MDDNNEGNIIFDYDSKSYVCIFETINPHEDFECAGDEVLVESSSPPASPGMAARLAAPAQDTGAGGGVSPSAVRELIVIPELPNSIQLQHAIHQVSTTVVEVNGAVHSAGDSSGQSSPTADGQHTYITVAMPSEWELDNVNSMQIKTELDSDHECEGGNGVNYHVQYVEPQEIYTQGHQTHMETIRTYPVYGVATVGSASAGAGDGSGTEGAWAGATAATAAAAGEFGAYGVAVAEEADAPASPAAPAHAPQPPRMPPATVQWLLDNYETAEGVSLPRSTLYAHYLRHCASHRLDPVNAASFGKLIRSVFVGLRTRRLGTRGNSKYHYYGIRAKRHANDSPPPPRDTVDENTDGSEQVESRPRESEPGAVGAGTVAAGGAYRQYLGVVEAPDPPPLDVAGLPDDLSPDALDAFRENYRIHSAEYLEAVASLDTCAVERVRRSFWRRCGRSGVRVASRREVAVWLRAAELRLHQRAVDLLLPDVLRPIPAHLTQAIRNFAKSVEGALLAGSTSGGAPAAATRASGAAAAALAGALRRYTSLNHLAQAARAVLANHHQIQQMVSDLNRVDFRVVREQAAWACSCGASAPAAKLEADFKATLGRGASLEQWAAWLEECVAGALAPHERRRDYTPRARRLLLDWSFYSSLVIRELTLRSAASFGSFHLIRLLYDEYVSYLIERRVAAHRRLPPIAVMHRALEEEEEEEQPCEEPPRGDEDEEAEAEWEWADDDDEDDELDPKRVKVSHE